MSEQINWSLSIQVLAGPKITEARPMMVEAYDKISVAVPAKDGAGPGKATVELQPGDAGQVKFLLLRCVSGVYDGKLSYKVNVDTATPVKLDELQLLMGDGALSLFGAAPKTLLFSNDSDKAASLDILVGRQAIPKP